MDVSANITIYHAVPTRSCRIVWLLEELGVPFKTVAVNFPTELISPEYIALNPMETCAAQHVHISDNIGEHHVCCIGLLTDAVMLL